MLNIFFEDWLGIYQCRPYNFPQMIQPVSEASKKHLLILLIEDNPADRMIFKEVLAISEVVGNIVKTASSLGEGMQMLKDDPPDILFLDLSLPDSNGLDGLKKVRAKYPHLPIVIQTGYAELESGIQSINLGAQDYLIKGEYDSRILIRSIYYSIERQKLSMDLEQTKRKVLDALLEGEQRERKRIAMELHDALLQKLAAIYLNLGLLKGKDAFDHDVYGDVRRMLKEVTQECRAISHDLMPPSLEEHGLFEALRQRFYELEQSSKVSIEYDYDETDVFLPSHERELFRIILELLSNSIRHGKADQITLSFKRNSYYHEVHYTDNGCGFDVKKVKEKASGLGMQNIYTRSKVMDAELEVVSEIGKGTVVRLSIPVLREKLAM